jgi:hypothetical protein
MDGLGAFLSTEAMAAVLSSAESPLALRRAIEVKLHVILPIYDHMSLFYLLILRRE